MTANRLANKLLDVIDEHDGPELVPVLLAFTVARLSGLKSAMWIVARMAEMMEYMESKFG